jgi:hypothetical protein
MTLAEWVRHQPATSDADWGVEVEVVEARDRAAEERAVAEARETDRMGSLAGRRATWGSWGSWS